MPGEEFRVIGLVADVLDRSRIQGVARAVGTSISFASNPAELASQISDATRTVFFDLNDPKVDALGAISDVASRRSRGQTELPRLIGFISHTDSAGRDAATDAGCDEVLPRSTFFKRLSVALAEAAKDD